MDLLAGLTAFVNDSPDWLSTAVPELAGLLHPSPDVVERFNVPYRTDPGADPDRHTLDVYAPAGRAGCPVLVFAHGGAWVFGTKDWFAPLGRSLAKAGIGCVAPNYRLSPRVTHPAHAEDVAGAVAWAVKHAPEFGGDPGKVFAGGHSAGGHLAALAALDPKYLAAEGLTPAAVRGVVGVSGVYRLSRRHPAFPVVFGTDPDVEVAASPITHVRESPPPCLLLYAERDYPTLDRMAADLAAAVRRHAGRAEAVEIPGVDHVTILLDAAAPSGRAAGLIRSFVAEHAGAGRGPAPGLTMGK